MPFFEYCTREPDVTVAAPLTGCGVVSASGITGVNLISLMVIVGFRGLVSLETVDLICNAAAKVVVCRMLHASPCRKAPSCSRGFVNARKARFDLAGAHYSFTARGLRSFCY